MTGYNQVDSKIELVHWGNSYTTTLEELFASSNSLPNTREPETYISVKENDRALKYNLIDSKHEDSENNIIRKSITPKKNSGFRARIITVKTPTLKTVIKTREQLKAEQIEASFTYAIKKSHNNFQLNKERRLKRVERHILKQSKRPVTTTVEPRNYQRSPL